MSKRLIIVLALAFVLGLSLSAYAEVQNVKVSGDITVEGVARDNFDLAKTARNGVIVNNNNEDVGADFLSITRVRVDADLTDNVMATVRLLNERNWNGEGHSVANDGKGQTLANTNIGLNSGVGNEENQIDLDLAYVTLKEFLYSPLTLTIGRQELHFGNELVVGDPDTNIYSARTSLAEGDLSARKSFDALRATLDYNPLVVDAIYAKVEEGAGNLNDDVTLTGLNASYALNKNTTIEGFFFSKIKGADAAAVYNVDRGDNLGWVGGGAGILTAMPYKDESDIVNTVGVRAVDKTVKNLTIDGQLAWQFGRYNPKFDPNARYDATSSLKALNANRNAWAFQLMAAYDLKDIAMISKWSPVISGSYTYLSGADRDRTGNQKKYKGWDPMFENQTVGHIMNAIFANTNMHRGSVSAKAKLTDDITANVDYVGAWFAKTYNRGTGGQEAERMAVLSGIAGTTVGTTARRFLMRDEKYIASEIDATLTYDYTEDVQFSLLGGLLLTGNAIRNIDDPSKDNTANATELIGSMKVTF